MKDLASFFQVRIIGLRTVGDPEAPLGRRILWAAALLSCFGLSLWYVVERTRFFVVNPVQSAITIAERTELSLPDITVCSRHRFNMTRLANMWRNFTGRSQTPDNVDTAILDYIDAPTMWEEAAYRLHELVHECKYMIRKSCLGASHWSAVMTAYGKCWTLRGPMLSSSGEKYGLELALNQGKLVVRHREREYFPMQLNWQVVVHARGIPPHSLIMEAGVVKRVFSMNNSQGVEYDVEEIGRFSIRVSEFASSPHGDSRCSPDENYTYEACQIKCFETKVLQETGCRMSFMKHVSGPVCRNKTQVVNIMGYLNRVSYEGTWGFDSCDCPQQCRETVYKVSMDTVQQAVPKGTGYGRCMFFFPELTPTVTNIDETPAYDFMDWFTAVGGVSNLLLGVSLLTFVEIIDIICLKLSRSRQMVEY